ncbi:MAG: hypothetical protein CMH60_07160 [Myxococcales bacterium]|nr:hypothetical protein [Myxococcales bacterium]
MKFSGEDGGYYVDLMKNLANGNGFLTNISTFHQGLPELPYPSIVYPLWPLVGGFFAWLFNITTAAYVISPLFYFLVVYLAYRVGKVFFPDIEVLLGGVRWNPGHMLAALFAINRLFFYATSRPYTESLAYILVLTTMLLAHKFLHEPSSLRGGALGLLCALALLCRTQMILVCLTVIAISALMILCAKERKPYFIGFAAFCVSFAVVFSPELLWLSQEKLQAGFGDYFRFSSYQRLKYLPPYETNIPVDGVVGYVLDRLQGFGEAFHPFGDYGYHKIFRSLHYNAVFFVAYFLTNPREFLGLFKADIRERIMSHRSQICLWVFGLGAFVSTHMIHIQSPSHEWYFATRHSMPVIFLFWLMTVFLLQRNKLWRNVAALCLALTICIGVMDINKAHRNMRRRSHTWPALDFRVLYTWLNNKTETDGRFTVVTNHVLAKFLAPFTSDVGYRTIMAYDDIDVLKIMFDKLESDYLILDTKPVGSERDEYKDLREIMNSTQVPGFTHQTTIGPYYIYKRAQ